MEEYQDRSLGGRVFKRLREDILKGRYKQQDELREATIGKELGVSRTPVREALRQLELEGLVTIVPNKGAYVTGISQKDIWDIYQMRKYLEGMCARWAAEHITEDQLEELEETILLSEFQMKKENGYNKEQVTGLDGRFHTILYEASGSRMLCHVLTDFHRYVQMARKSSINVKARAEKSIEEHKAILQAIRDRNPELAEQLAKEHIVHVMQNLKKIRRKTKIRRRQKMEKIKMTTPLVEMDGDEMTRILWKMIKDNLLEPYIDLKTEYYDLGLEHRNETDDQVTVDSALATKKYKVAVKCATITPNAARMDEYDLKEMWKSPNGTIRAILDGTVFRAPIVVKGIEPCVKNWKKPITIARHAYGDVYKGSEMKIPGAGKVELVYTAEDGSQTKELVHEFDGPGIVQGMHNINKSIESFARSCFSYALDTKQDLWFATKDTISKKYDHTFKDIFQEIFDAEYADQFKEAGIEYFYTLIDDAVARVMKSEGGFIWACKNYDGDVMSDMVSSAFGSLAMMTSVLVSPDGYYEYEAAHGTVQRHYYKHLKGEETSTNSVATIFAWTGALRKRGELDGNKDLMDFADKLEKATIDTIEAGEMTKDLALITTIENPTVLNSEEFIKAIAKRL